MTLQETRKKWTDALEAFGASIEVEQLPEWVEHRPGESRDEQPYRVIVLNRENVSGALLVEIDDKRDEVIRAFGGDE